MRDLLHRLGCLFQIVFTVAIGVTLGRYTTLAAWVCALLAVPLGMAATALFMVVSGWMLDRLD